MGRRLGAVIIGLLCWGTLGCAGLAETPGERFDQAMKKFSVNCAKAKLKPNDTACDILKLKPADPLATGEGRFAHSIKIPNPVPEDSGYKPGMTPQEYFDHLCKTEAGEFIYKTAENVEGIMQLRQRGKANYEYSHLYAFEDPFGFEVNGAEVSYVSPERYAYYEIAAIVPQESVWRKDHVHPSMLEGPPQYAKYTRYFGYDGHSLKTMQRVYDARRKSRYGYTWRGIVRPHDREMGIGGGEVIILDLETNEVLGLQRGYAKFEIDERFGLARAGWRNRCPISPGTAGPHQDFILRVLKPANFRSAVMGEQNASK